MNAWHRGRIYVFAGGIICGVFSSAVHGTTEQRTAREQVEIAIQKAQQHDIKGAIAGLKFALKLDGKLIAAWLKLADIYLEIGSGAAAENALRKAADLGADRKLTEVPLARSYLLQNKLEKLNRIEIPEDLDPSDQARLLVIQGQGLIEADHLDDAESAFDKAYALDRSSVDAFFGHASALMRKGDLDRASAFIRRAIATKPDSAEGWYLSGELARRQRDSGVALANFSKAIELQPQHIPARLGRAALLLDAGRTNDAASDLQVIQESQPDDLQGLYLTALLQVQTGKLDNANQTLEKARGQLKSVPSSVSENHMPSLMLGAVLALKDGEPQSALAYLNRYLNRAPDHLGASKLLAVARLRTSDIDGARALLDHLATVYPDDAGIYSLLGTVYTRSGDYFQAQANLAHAISLGVDTTTIRRQLGLAQLATGETEAALASFGAAAATDSGKSNAGLLMAITALQEGSPAQALATIQKLIETVPPAPVYRNFAGALQLMLNRPDEAKAHFNAALKLDPNYLPAHLNLANLARQARRWDEAETIYRTLLEKHPKDLGVLRGLVEVADARHDEKATQRWLETIRSEHPESVQDRLVLVAFYIQSKQFDQAKREIDVLRESHPSDVLPALQSVDLAAAQGQSDTLPGLLKAAHDIAPKEAKALRQVSHRQVHYGYLEDARVTSSEILALNPDDRIALQELAELEIQLGMFDRAFPRIKALEDRYPSSPVGPGLRAKLALAKRDYPSAVMALETAQLRDPTATPIALALAEARARSGDVNRAISDLRERMRIDPDSRDIQKSLASVLLEAERWREAADIYEQLLAGTPDDIVLINNLALTYLELSDPRAVDYAKRLADMHSNDPALLDTAGWVLARNGKTEQGIALLRDALARASTVPDIKYHLALALKDSGKSEEAISLLSEVATTPGFAGQADANRLLVELRKQH